MLIAWRTSEMTRTLKKKCLFVRGVVDPERFEQLLCNLYCVKK